MRLNSLLKFLLTFFFAFVYGRQLFAAPFDIVTSKTRVSIFYDRECKLDSIAAHLLASDIELLCGYRPFTSADFTHATGNIIVIGSVSSRIIGQFATRTVTQSLKGKWECYNYRLIDRPRKNIKSALIICGSDFRGTAYGVFDLSARLGVSPWYWWADVTPAKQKSISIDIADYTSAPPSVKYRGIFINDEDWGLQPWAAKTFEPETGDIGPKTYARVFELLLRLKANLVWPAMHPGTKAFFHYPGNLQTAQAYQIIIGSSHAEPMMRNNVDEWNEKKMGSFNYLTNKQNVYNYWELRVKESSRINSMYTLGMRGVHDSGLEGIKDPKEAVPLLEGIFEDQRAMLSKYVNKDVTTIPQVFTVYKEVLDIYDNNLKLPEDVTIVWPDDNYGYIQRLNNDREKTRKGGSGVYYHASYWGRPHDYLWLGSTHPSLMREEMMKAFETGANTLWVLNVGDIKPLEYNIQLLMDMAYNAMPFKSSGFTKQHLFSWLAFIFGKDKAARIQPVLWEYYQLAFERRPEFMGWSQTEPTTKTSYSDFNHFFYGDEAQRRIDRYQLLEDQVKALRAQTSLKDADAFYELVYYPVVGASLMNKKFLYRDKSLLYSRQKRLSALDYGQMSRAAYDSIISETNYYNNQLAGGKWKHIMSMKPRELPVYDAPVLPEINIDGTAGWSVAPEGFVTKDSSLLKVAKAMMLPSFDALNRQRYFIDIFLNDDKTVEWTASVSDARIQISKNNGRLSARPGQKQLRIYVTIDWSKDSERNELAGQIIFKGEGKQIAVAVNGSNLSISLEKTYNGFIENNGYVSLHAAHYTKMVNRKSGRWQVLYDQGYTGETLEAQALPLEDTLHLIDKGWISENCSFVEYDFYTFSPHDAWLTVFSLPTHPLNKNYSMGYAISIDKQPLKIMDFRTVGRSEEWKQNVLKNRAERKTQMSFLDKGKHSLRIYSVDPGVILTNILVDLGGLKQAYGLVAETKLAAAAGTAVKEGPQ